MSDMATIISRKGDVRKKMVFNHMTRLMVIVMVARRGAANGILILSTSSFPHAKKNAWHKNSKTVIM